jgi:lysozyme
MAINAAGLALIKHHEGKALKAYRDRPDIGGGVWTIGYGHTSMAGPPAVHGGLTITAAEAEAILARDLETFERHVRELVKVPLNDNQFAALVSFCMNVGPDRDNDGKAEGLGGSTLLKFLNLGDYDAAALQFRKWVFDNGTRLKDLITRRADEEELFRTPSSVIVHAGKAAAVPPAASPPSASPVPPPPAAPAPPPSMGAVLALLVLGAIAAGAIIINKLFN